MPDGAMTFQVGWGPRLLGLLVLAGVAAAIVALSPGLPVLTWIVLGVFGVTAAVATLSNFGERLHVDESGLRWENVILRAAGLRRERRASWADIHSVVELDGKTLFVTVEGQPRWVLDALEGVDVLRGLLGAHGIPVETRTKPRLRDLGRGTRDTPPS